MANVLPGRDTTDTGRGRASRETKISQPRNRTTSGGGGGGGRRGRRSGGVTSSGGGVNPTAAAASGGAAGGTAANPDSQALAMRQIETQISAIEARYGLSRQELLADESDIGRQYRLLLVQASQMRDKNIRAAKEQAAERGLTRSGILARDLADVETQSAQQIGALEAAQAEQEAGFQRQLASLPQLQAAEIAAAVAAGQDIILDADILAALLEGGVTA